MDTATRHAFTTSTPVDFHDNLPGIRPSRASDGDRQRDTTERGESSSDQESPDDAGLRFVELQTAKQVLQVLRGGRMDVDASC